MSVLGFDDFEGSVGKRHVFGALEPFRVLEEVLVVGTDLHDLESCGRQD